VATDAAGDGRGGAHPVPLLGLVAHPVRHLDVARVVLLVLRLGVQEVLEVVGDGGAVHEVDGPRPAGEDAQLASFGKNHAALARGARLGPQLAGEKDIRLGEVRVRGVLVVDVLERRGDLVESGGLGKGRDLRMRDARVSRREGACGPFLHQCLNVGVREDEIHKRVLDGDREVLPSSDARDRHVFHQALAEVRLCGALQHVVSLNCVALSEFISRLDCWFKFGFQKKANQDWRTKFANQETLQMTA